MLSNDVLAVLGRTAATIAGIQAEKEMAVSEKNEAILRELCAALTTTGRVFIVGDVPCHVMNDGRLMWILPKDRMLDEVLIACGLMPELSGNIDKALMRFLVAGNFPESEVIGISKYLPEEHALLLNEWNDRYIRIDPNGHATRHVNGEGGFLFEHGRVPHSTDLNTINHYTGPAFGWTEESPLVKHVFSSGVFSETSGVGRQVALDVLTAWTLAGFLPERIKAQPLLHLHGLGGTRKTAIATALGWVLSPEGLGFRVVAAPDDRKEMETTLINARGLLCLDEANNLRTLFSLLKAVVTNATIERRILYTTASVQRFVIKLLCILTTNNIELFDEAVARRVLKLDMGNPRHERVEYRSDGAVEREWREGNLREACWQELVCRLSAVMRLLSAARVKGEDDPTVRYRMSGFWSFVTAVARQDGGDIADRMKAAMIAIHDEQSRSVNTADDLLPLLQQWLVDHPEKQGRDLTASEISSGLLSYPNINFSLAKVLGSALLLSNKLTASSEYIRLLGLEVVNGKRTKKFRFDLSKVQPEDSEAIKVSHLRRSA